MSQHQVRDGARVLQFKGDLIAHSTSWHRGSDRWVEFVLYKTVSGSYVLGRTGFSLLYHVVTCPIVQRNSLSPSPSAALVPDSVPCSECSPSPAVDAEVCIETPRHWAQVSETPEGIIEALERRDGHGSRYLTRVAERLLDQAGALDPALDSVYRVEHIA